jgi:two-component system chemotaxis sensor kinase CheA
VLVRPLRPGEVSLDELELAFRATPGPAAAEAPSSPPAAAEKAPSVPAGGVVAGVATPTSGRDDDRTDGKIANQSLRVHLDTLEHLMTMVSELVPHAQPAPRHVRRHEDRIQGSLAARNVTAELQEGVMKTRMQPIGNAWQKLPRIVRDLSAELGKPIEFEMHGADTELDRQVLDMIKDPLTHMVRNSADHGIEMPDERRATGKPEKGTLRLSAWHQGGHIIIEVADDGCGLDIRRIKATAVARGLASEADIETMSEALIHNHLRARLLHCQQGDQRVRPRRGMDVVRSNVEQIGGTIDVNSVLGQGTSFTHQDSAHARHRPGLDCGSRRRPLRHPADCHRRARARGAIRTSHRAHQGCGGASPAPEAPPARPPRDTA